MTTSPLCRKRHCGRGAVLRDGDFAGLCMAHMESKIADMPTEELADVPGAVLALFNLKP